MSKKLKKIEDDIVEEYKKKESMDMSFPNMAVMPSFSGETSESINTNILSLQKLREFELDRISRLWYNQNSFHILITAVISIITTVVAAWIITKFI
jgi:hypothetical protein